LTGAQDQFEVDFIEKRLDNLQDRSPKEEEEEAKERKRRRELVLEQAGLTKKGRQRAIEIKEARNLQIKQKREKMKAAYIERQVSIISHTDVTPV